MRQAHSILHKFTLPRWMQKKPEAPGKIFTNQQLKALIWPLILEQILIMAVGLSDTVMVSFVGEAAVSGVSLVDMINQLMIGVLAALATGGAVIASQYLGGNKPKKACETGNQLFWVLLVISTLLSLLIFLFRGQLIPAVFGSLDPKVLDSSLTYLMISALSYPFIALYNGGAALFRAMGNSKITLKVAFFMNVVNISCNALFIFGFHLGVAGSALGSLIARAASALVIHLLLKNPTLLLHYLPFVKTGLDFKTIKKILFIGIPSGIENGFFQLGRILVVAMIATFGTTEIAANAVANNFDGLGIIPGGAMMLAMITIVGQCVGALDYKQAQYYVKKIMKLTFLAFFIWNGIILLTLKWSLQLYSLSPQTMELAKKLIFIHDGMAIFLWPISFVLPNALRAGNDVRFTMSVSVFSMLVFRIFFSYYLGVYLGFGAIGVWIAMIIDWTCRSILFVIRYKSGKWQHVRI